MKHETHEKKQICPAAIKAAEKVDRLLFFILANSSPDEEWREISWADSNYFVSNKGQIISLCNSRPRILKPFVCNDYLCVSICGRDRRINRLVAQAFLDNPENKPVAHHKNHNKMENTVENLEWATYSENTAAYYQNKREQIGQKKREESTE